MSEQDEDNASVDLDAVTARLPSRGSDEPTLSDFPSFMPLKDQTLSQQETATRSIAVLPFKTLGAIESNEDEYLGLGMADALITTLSNLRQLVVRPTNS